METRSVNGTRHEVAAAQVGWGSGLASGDPEVAAAVLALKDAQQVRRDAHVRREAAHEDRIALQLRQVDKLRELAGNALWSGVFQAAIGVASSVAAFAQGLSQVQIGEAERQLLPLQQELGACKAAGLTARVAQLKPDVALQGAAIEALGRTAACSGAAAAGLGALSQADPVRIASAGLERDKAALQVEIERASQLGDLAGEAMAEASRRQGSLLTLMQRAGEARAQAEAAATR